MESDSRPSDRTMQVIEEEATNWFLERRHQPIPSSRETAFNEWRKADPRHWHAYLAAEIAWGSAERKHQEDAAAANAQVSSSAQNGTERPDAFRLPRWPEDWEEIEESLDPASIQEHGKSLLYRALNTRHLVAFVGSGVSAAYGRVSWAELVLFHVQELQKLLPSSPSQSDRGASGPESRRTALMRQLAQITKSGRATSGDKIMTAMMLCEQVWHATPLAGEGVNLGDLARRFNLDPSEHRRGVRSPEQPTSPGKELFRHWIKRETHDEIPHVLRVLAGTDSTFIRFLHASLVEDVQARANSPARKLDAMARLAEALVRRRPLLRENAARSERSYAFLFDNTGGKTAIAHWLEALKPSSARLPKEQRVHDRILICSREVLASLQKATQGEAISPARYFAFGFVLDLIRMTGGNDEARAVLTRVLEKAPPNLPPTVRRSALIPRAMDPLHKLAYDLEVHRFATTNYDLEIERFFHDTAFAPPQRLRAQSSPATSIDVGPIGGRTRDFVLSENTVADFLDFAINDNAYALEVVHLHGRATDDSPIVVTERDYQNLYVRDTVFQSAFNEARAATFGGNPVLFVGFGMTESDVLHPLRRFVTGPFRRNRSVIALLPADRAADDCDSFAMDQYVKHGVSIIRYDLNVDGQEEVGMLCRLFTEIADIGRDLETFEKSPTAANRATVFSEARFAFLEEQRKNIFYCDGVPCDIRFEMEFLHQFVTLLRDLNNFGTSVEKRFGNVLATLERVKVSIQTSALNSKLVAIRRGWQTWWKDWRRMPLNRADFQKYSCKRPPDTGQLDSPEHPKAGPIWSRHRVYESPPPGAHEAKKPPRLWPSASLADSTVDSRRCLVVVAPKGAGKGNLYSYLTETWEPSRKAEISYVGQFFATFGLTSEIASVWDALPLFLLAPDKFPRLGYPQNPPLEDDAETWKEIESQGSGIRREEFRRWSRRERLDRALRFAGDRLKKASEGVAGKKVRLLIGFGMLEALFDEQGREKQGEIRDMFATLLSSAHEDARIDLFFLVRDTHLPAWFRRPPESPPPKAESATDCRSLHIDNLWLLLPEQPPTPEFFETVLSSLKRSMAHVHGLDATTATTDDLRQIACSKPSPGVTNFISMLPRLEPTHFNPESFVQKVQTFLEAGLERRGRGPEALGVFFRHDLAGSRYAYTLVIKIVADIFQESRDAPERHERLDTLLCYLDIMPRGYEGRLSDKFFEIVFDYWFDRSSIVQCDTQDDPTLHELLVRHIAVVATPVRAHVLAHCPLIRERLEQLGKLDGKALQTDDERTELIAKALERLVQRSIVMRLDAPDATEALTESSWNNHYQVHREVQKHVYRRLGATQSAMVDGNIFAPSLYAAQTRNFPRLYQTAYAFLYKLVDHLSHYPNPLGEAPRRDHASPAPEIVADCLRAALGVTRTLFSLGVVLRFADSDGLPLRSTAEMGYLEHHRLVIRWMLRLAVTLDNSLPRGRPPLNRDEAVWLYNECGVFSYAQGRCDDARALFEQAMALQTEIDGPGGGPMRRRILVNSGLNSIDRGRLSLARRAFTEARDRGDDAELSCVVADGFLGVVDHFSGELDSARKAYDRAIGKLQALKRIRPLAVLKQYSGYLYLHTGQYQPARAAFRETIQLAETGGYADLSHYARIAEVRGYLRDPNAVCDFTRASKCLNLAQKYADLMDNPRLTVEVLLLRGELLARQGETTEAGNLISSALQIANLNGLMLRRLFALELLAKVYDLRENPDVAEKLRSSARHSAREMGYGINVLQTDRVPA